MHTRPVTRGNPELHPEEEDDEERHGMSVEEELAERKREARATFEENLTVAGLELEYEDKEVGGICVIGKLFRSYMPVWGVSGTPPHLAQA